ncbi:MAG: hypothetical protein HSCHL_1831 [Hydrogenibacillus schlegelii]|uniref:Uncharacterized protein n=1 Tax=Hydrogenibacillus schlegelii TaxID=1484 RepID=A0A2T5GFC6_HYDSH|nr:MAG: hypothetical protein HSCHL_1831 [Hydrogenibacillus schlegelii]
MGPEAPDEAEDGGRQHGVQDPGEEKGPEAEIRAGDEGADLRLHRSSRPGEDRRNRLKAYLRRNRGRRRGFGAEGDLKKPSNEGRGDGFRQAEKASGESGDADEGGHPPGRFQKCHQNGKKDEEPADEERRRQRSFDAVGKEPAEGPAVGPAGGVHRLKGPGEELARRSRRSRRDALVPPIAVEAKQNPEGDRRPVVDRGEDGGVGRGVEKADGDGGGEEDRVGGRGKGDEPLSLGSGERAGLPHADGEAGRHRIAGGEADGEGKACRSRQAEEGAHDRLQHHAEKVGNPEAEAELGEDQKRQRRREDDRAPDFRSAAGGVKDDAGVCQEGGDGAGDGGDDGGVSDRTCAHPLASVSPPCIPPVRSG